MCGKVVQLAMTALINHWLQRLRIIYSVLSPLWESTQCTQYKEDKQFRVSFLESLRWVFFPLVCPQLLPRPARRTTEPSQGSEKRRITPCPRALQVRCNKHSPLHHPARALSVLHSKEFAKSISGEQVVFDSAIQFAQDASGGSSG